MGRCKKYSDCREMDAFLRDLERAQRERERPHLLAAQNCHQRIFKTTEKRVHALPKARHVR